VRTLLSDYPVSGQKDFRLVLPESLVCYFTRTQQQEFYAGSFMTGFALFANNRKDEACSTISYWETNYAAMPKGEVHLGF
jgi:hypothetical protein